MYEGNTYENLKEEMLEEITLTDKREGSYANDMISSSAIQGEKYYVELEHVRSMAFLENCTGEDADLKAGEEGLARKEGTKSEGTVTFTGETGVEIPLGTLCSTVSGLHFVTTEAGIIGDEGMVTLPIEAEEIGDKYNVLAGYINTLPVAINDVTGITNAEGTIGGTEEETDKELMARVLLKKRTPGTSGNKYHYLEWALEVDGVGDAKIFSLDNGPGTVGVMPITSSGRAPDDDILTAVAANIEAKRPIGATVSVYAPEEVMIAIGAEIEITSAVTLTSVTAAYKALFETYIKNSVFNLTTVDYYRCLSMFYDISGVTSVKTFTMNGGTESIVIKNKQIQVAGDVTITEVVAE